MIEKLKVALIYGGISSEREISIKSGKSVERVFKKLGVNYRVFDPIERERFISGLVHFKPDVAFLALHGKGGEDGTIQGVLEFLNIPYTGSGVKASAIAMDKALTKKILKSEGIKVPEGTVVCSLEELSLFPLPAVVKPSKEGSSVGVFIVKSEEELINAVKNALKLDNTIIVEEYIKGRELTVGYLNGEPLEIVEIVVEDGFYDYKNKYFSGKTEYICPAHIESNLYREIQDIARRSCEIVGIRGAARVDIILSEDNVPYVLEINTIPGLTDKSLLPKSAKASGINFEELIEKMVIEAVYEKEETKK